jgi:hypothetical protein
MPNILASELTWATLSSCRHRTHLDDKDSGFDGCTGFLILRAYMGLVDEGGPESDFWMKWSTANEFDNPLFDWLLIKHHELLPQMPYATVFGHHLCHFFSQTAVRVSILFMLLPSISSVGNFSGTTTHHRHYSLIHHNHKFNHHHHHHHQ